MGAKPSNQQDMGENFLASFESIQKDYQLRIINVIRGRQSAQWKEVNNIILYQGEWKDGVPHGIGKFFKKKNLELIIADFYEGHMIRDRCIKIFGNKNIYNGPLDQKHRMNGLGEIEGPQFIYHGQFWKDMIHGFGRYEIKGSDNFYEGSFQNNNKVKGVENYKKQVYEGTFENNMKDGMGILRWKQGGRYEGEFSNDMKNGKGTLFDADGNLVRKGMWKNDKMSVEK